MMGTQTQPGRVGTTHSAQFQLQLQVHTMLVSYSPFVYGTFSVLLLTLIAYSAQSLVTATKKKLRAAAAAAARKRSKRPNK